MPFERRSKNELDRLDDEGLIAYAVAAREAAELEAMADALAVLAYRRFGDLVRRALLKLPRADAEDVAAQAMSQAVLAEFEGRSVGEFVKLVHTILSRRIADYHEKAKRSLDTTQLPEEHRDDEGEGHRRDVAVSPDEVGEVDTRSVVDQLLKDLSPQHRRTVELYVLDDLSAENAANQVNEEFPDSNPQMSVDNVHKIASRFRKHLRGLLDDD